MSTLPLRSADMNVWPRTTASTATGPSTTGPIPIGGGGAISAGLPTVNNPNLPLSTLLNTSNMPPPVPQPPRTPFPSIRPASTPFPSLQQSATPFPSIRPAATQFPSLQQPGMPFPSIRPPFNTTNSISTNPYATAQPFPPYNPRPANFVCNLLEKKRLIDLSFF